MIWSPQQDEALITIGEWLKSDAQVFKLFGFAGTGKTTLARHIAEMSGLRTAYCAFTGKAALVMQRSGCAGASTIHRFIYNPKHKSREHLRLLQLDRQSLEKIGDPIKIEEIDRAIAAEQKRLRGPGFMLKSDVIDETGPWDFGLIIVDECSMVNREIGNDLLSFGIKILVLGDPAQLPPVMGAGFFTASDPDFMLTEIHRQAQDNPIIRIATHVRNTGRLPASGQYGGSSIVDFDASALLSADQVLVGTHKTRKGFNGFSRRKKKFAGPLPLKGEKLICLRNNYQNGLLNGSMWTVEEFKGNTGDATFEVKARNEDELSSVHTHCWRYPFFGEDCPDDTFDEFDFGYAITVHKAQGSQWPNVTLVDQTERMASFMSRASASKWLYTGVTRAMENITILRKDS